MLQYIIKLSISLSLVYLFYQLFLRRLTFYNWNRWYLLIYSMVCFVIPFVNVFTIIVEQPALRESALINYIPAITQISPAEGSAVATQATGINWLQVAVIVIISGMLLMVVRLLLQYYSLYKMRSKAVLLYDEKVKLYHIDEPVIPFSFGRGIYVNQHQHSEHELKEIIRHEFIHVKQRHSIDILWSELLCILNWYNPFAWLLRHDIRQNLEFIADQQVLQTGLDRKQYQYLLLKVIGVNSFSIATNFNFSSLKRRIAMMNKSKSARVHLIRFLFLLPLLVVVLLAFRNTTQQGHYKPLKEAVTDTIPGAVKTPPGWKDINTIDVTDSRKVTIRLKNGKMEKYDLMIPKDKEAFEKKYGALPEPPTPPEPLTQNEKELPEVPEAPEKPEMPEAPEKPEATERPEAPERPEPAEKPELAELPERQDGWGIIAQLERGKSGTLVSRRIDVPNAPEAPQAPEAPEMAPITINLQDCLNKKGYCITVADNYGECVVIIKDKNNKIVEAITLTDWNLETKKYEDKYGEIPPRQIRLMPKQVTGYPAKDKQVMKVEATPATAKTYEVAVIDRKADAKAAVSEKIAAAVKATSATRAKADEVVVIGRKADANVVVSEKIAAAAKANPATTAKSHGVLIITKKSDAKVVTGTKGAATIKAEPVTEVKLTNLRIVQGKPPAKTEVKAEKPVEKPKEAAETKKLPAGQPDQEQ